jgi:hypothetical protein
MKVTDKMIKAYSKAMRNTINMALADDDAGQMDDIVKAAIANGIEAAIGAMEPTAPGNVGIRLVPQFPGRAGPPLSVSLARHTPTTIRLAAISHPLTGDAGPAHVEIPVEITVL